MKGLAMQMTLTITAESPAEMVTVLKALQVSGVETPVQLVTAKQDVKEETKVAEPEPVVEPPAKRIGRPPGAKNLSPMLKAVDKALKEEPVVEPAKLSVVPKKEEKKEPEKRKDITILDVRKALTEYLAANSEAAAAELLLKHGKTDRLSKLAPEYLEAVYHAAVTPVVKAEFDDDLSGVGHA